MPRRLLATVVALVALAACAPAAQARTIEVTIANYTGAPVVASTTGTPSAKLDPGGGLSQTLAYTQQGAFGWTNAPGHTGMGISVGLAAMGRPGMAGVITAGNLGGEFTRRCWVVTGSPLFWRCDITSSQSGDASVVNINLYAAWGA